MKFPAFVSALLFVLLCLLVTPGAASADDRALTEKEKIEALIAHVENLKGAAFIRNGTEYDAAAAAKFLRGKWKANKGAIQSASNFIAKAASRSSTSGKPYLIRLKGGKATKSGDYLRAQLQLLEKSGSAR